MSFLYPDYQKQSTTFSYTGSKQTFTVPDNLATTKVTLKIWGAGTGRPGGYVEGVYNVKPGDVLDVYVGGSNSGRSGGWPGGGTGAHADNDHNDVANADGGAGYSAVRTENGNLVDTIALAAGAGGDGDADTFDGLDSGGGSTGAGGEGGANTGQNGGDASDFNAQGDGGQGGDQSSGGAGGQEDGGGTSGGQGTGGNGGSRTDFHFDNNEGGAGAGGGGGAGWRGGGGGAAGAYADNATGSGAGGGGAGGSNYDDDLAEVLANQRGSGNTGNGQVIIEYMTIAS